MPKVNNRKPKWYADNDAIGWEANGQYITGKVVGSVWSSKGWIYRVLQNGRNEYWYILESSADFAYGKCVKCDCLGDRESDGTCFVCHRLRYVTLHPCYT